MSEADGAPPLAPGAGDLATVMQRGAAAPVSAEGTFTGQRGFQLMVAFTGGCPFTGEEDVLMACGEMGERDCCARAVQGTAGDHGRLQRLSGLMHPRKRIEKALKVTSNSAVDDQAPQ